MFTVEDLKVMKSALETESGFLLHAERYGVHMVGLTNQVNVLKAKVGQAIDQIERNAAEKAKKGENGESQAGPKEETKRLRE